MRMARSGFFMARIRLDCDWLSFTRKQALEKMNPPDITTSLGEGTFVIKGLESDNQSATHGICCQELETTYHITYHIVMGRSKNIKCLYLNNDGENWIDNKYALFPKGNQEKPGRGQSGFFSINDTPFVLYYAYLRSDDGAPLLNIKPLYTDDEGWPTLDDTSSDLFQRLK